MRGPRLALPTCRLGEPCARGSAELTSRMRLNQAQEKTVRSGDAVNTPKWKRTLKQQYEMWCGEYTRYTGVCDGSRGLRRGEGRVTRPHCRLTGLLLARRSPCARCVASSPCRQAECSKCPTVAWHCEHGCSPEHRGLIGMAGPRVSEEGSRPVVAEPAPPPSWCLRGLTSQASKMLIFPNLMGN